MPTSVKLPRLGESVAEGTIGAWLKQEGDLVEKDEAIAEIITDKINAELPSPVAGRLVKIVIGTDETVAVGTEIALIEEENAVVVEARAAIENGHVDKRERIAKREPKKEEEERLRISPLARRLAREHGIDLHMIAGTGAGGRVRKEDILAYVAGNRSVARVASLPAGVATPIVPDVPVTVAPEPFVTQPGQKEEVIVPDRMRLAIAEHMVRSKRTSPHATTVVEVDMTNIARWLEKNKESFKRREGYSISYMPFVVKAVCEGIRKVPLINSTWTADNRIIVKRQIHLGVAVATEEGLLVPTLYDADQYTLNGLAKQISMLAQKARTNTLRIQELQNSTFVVTNPGVFGTIISMPIINQPHAAIMSMDAVVKRAVVIEDDAIAVRSMMYLSLSFDHRILDGAGAAGFLQAVRNKLQSYGREIDVN